MIDSALQFFRNAIETPSPSGFEERIQKLVTDYISPHAEEVRTDSHGNVIATAGNPDGPRLMYAGHCDQIGMLICHIDDLGFLYAQTIGGWDPQQLVGQAMTIWTDDGPVPAVISRKPIHLLTPDERKKVVELQELWLDIGATSKEEAASVVKIGDPVTLDLNYRKLMGDRVSGPGMDNKTGMWSVMEALRRTVAEAGDSPVGCHLHSVKKRSDYGGLRRLRAVSIRMWRLQSMSRMHRTAPR